MTDRDQARALQAREEAGHLLAAPADPVPELLVVHVPRVSGVFASARGVLEEEEDQALLEDPAPDGTALRIVMSKPPIGYPSCIISYKTPLG